MAEHLYQTELVAYAVCVVMRKALPHTPQRQYLSGLGRRIPRARAVRGDTIFWATNGDCRAAVKHVALVKDARIMLHKPTRLGRAREQIIFTQAGSLKICPDAIRLEQTPVTSHPSFTFCYEIKR
jgi:cell wall-associated NlpC family hydrolase